MHDASEMPEYLSATELLRLQKARQQLNKASSIEQLKGIRQSAEKIRIRAQQASLGLELQNMAAELKLQAERRVGKMLSELKLRGGDRKTNARPNPLKLKDLGIDKNQSARWQLEATVPEKDFREFIEQAHKNAHEISSAALIRLAKQLRESGTTLAIDSVWSNRSYIDTTVTRADLRKQLEELSCLLSDARQHGELLTHLVQALCDRTRVTPDVFERRALERYVAEITSHLQRAERQLKNSVLARRFYDGEIGDPGTM